MRERRIARVSGWAGRLALVAALALACGLEPVPPERQQPGGGAPRESLPPPGYRVVFEDGFDGTALDARRWTALSGPRRDALATPLAASVANGLLTVTTFTEGGVHRTGFVTTEGRFAARYGYWEARIRFFDAPGSWCAFWISTATVDDGVGNPGGNGTEIDVVEHRVTDQGGWTELADMVALNVNWDGYGPDKKTAQLVTHLADGAPVQGEWHVYSVLWTASGYVYYVDGVELWRPDAPVSHVPEDIRLTCEVQDDSWAGFVPAGGYGTRAASTTRMEVDWVRVWQP
ncbi:MAG TPA: glycoside hydrolase family 16 protein [Anaeromyxobacter sp.]|nr:glycoside hydrolase family 16 protein [Anaeromyxobacter sp.]